MSCKDFETDIYLYTELSVKEKELLDSHLQTCQMCSALFKEVRHSQDLIHQVAEEKAIPTNAARLTSTIMSKIISNKRQREISFADFFFGRARLVMTVLSIGLLISFAIEFLDVSSPSTAPKIAGSSIILTGKNFRENFSRGKVKPTLFASCRSPFKSGQYYLDCVKSKLK